MRLAISTPIPILLLTFAVQTRSQSTDFPQCWQSCLQASSPDCNPTDLNCICSHATLPRLPPLRDCISTSCPSPSTPSLLLAPLQEACALSNTPIASSVISSLDAAATHDVPRPTLLFASPASATAISTSTAKKGTPTASAKSGGDNQGGGDGTVFDLEGSAAKSGPASLLGLTVGILAGIAWF